MPLEIYAVTSDPTQSSSVKLENSEVLTTLGSSEDNIAIQLKELLNSVTESISEDAKEECNVSIEVSGTVNLKAQGGIKYLFFNIGGEASTTNNMKVVLSTKILPKKKATN